MRYLRYFNLGALSTCAGTGQAKDGLGSGLETVKRQQRPFEIGNFIRNVSKIAQNLIYLHPGTIGGGGRGFEEN